MLSINPFLERFWRGCAGVIGADFIARRDAHGYARAARLLYPKTFHYDGSGRACFALAGNMPRCG